MCKKRPKYGENVFKMAKIGATWDQNGSKKGQKYQNGVKIESKWGSKWGKNRSKWSKTGSKWLKMGQRRVKWATMGRNGSK